MYLRFNAPLTFSLALLAWARVPLVDELMLRWERGAAWNTEMSRSVLRSELAGDEVLLVSNGEPYIPMYQGDEIAMRFFMVSHGGHRIAERIDRHREHTVEIG